MDAELANLPGAEATSKATSGYYGSYYYKSCLGLPYERNDVWLRQFRGVAERIAIDVAPRTVLDAGCAIGLLVETLRERGIDAEGFDISDYAVGQAHESIREKVRVGSILEPFGRRYDLVVSIEVLEHLKPHEAEPAVANMCAHADTVLFSSTPFDYKEASHFNVQPPEYWAELFARSGFQRDLDYDAGFLTTWAVLFRKGNLPAHRVVAGYERKLWRLLQENSGARESLVEHQDALARADSERAAAVARHGALEIVAREHDARIAERLAAEAALATEFREAVKTWSDHVEALGQHIRRAVEDQRVLTEALEDRDRRLVEAEQRYAGLAESEGAARIAGREAVEALAQARAELDSVAASRAWRLVDGLARVRRVLAREGARRGEAIRGLLTRRSGRIDKAHQVGERRDK